MSKFSKVYIKSNDTVVNFVKMKEFCLNLTVLVTLKKHIFEYSIIIDRFKFNYHILRRLQGVSTSTARIFRKLASFYYFARVEGRELQYD